MNESARNFFAKAVYSDVLFGLTNKGSVLCAFSRLDEFTRPMQRISSFTDIVSIAAGNDHVVALRSNGTVVAFCNKVGHPEVCDTDTWHNVISIAAAGNMTFGLTESGQILSCGLIDNPWYNPKHPGRHARTSNPYARYSFQSPPEKFLSIYAFCVHGRKGPHGEYTEVHLCGTTTSGEHYETDGLGICQYGLSAGRWNRCADHSETLLDTSALPNADVVCVKSFGVGYVGLKKNGTLAFTENICTDLKAQLSSWKLFDNVKSAKLELASMLELQRTLTNERSALLAERSSLFIFRRERKLQINQRLQEIDSALKNL